MRTQVMLIATMAAGGCSFSSSSKPTDAQAIDMSLHDGPPDAPIDAAPDAAQQDFGTGVWTVHVPTLPTAGVIIMGNIDTSPGSNDCSANAMWVDSSQPDACFIVGKTIDTGNTVAARGPRPLVLVATDAITISKSVDVASHRSQLPGAGADWSGCGSPTAGANRTTGGGGGAGGTYITVGGSGGQGDNAQSNAGVAVNTPLPGPSILHGGCPGSDGGSGSTNPLSRGASGGGAIYLVAGNTITITSAGLINASGAGPNGGGHQTGGGGAGSGGTIVLYAPAITATGGKLMTNGGGGAGGGDNNSNGTNGNDAMAAMPLAQAPGGPGPNGINGSGGLGDSAMGGASTGIGGNSGEGGGGGGGGAGYIRSNVMLTGAIASPAVDVVP